MADALVNNPIALRGCILYEFIEGKKPFETYQKLMEKLGDDFMDYPEFEFWFMRFAQGKYDLDYDRSLDPKTRLFTDLPVEVFETIGESLDSSDRFALRKVSKDIQEFVDSWVPRVTDISLDGCWRIRESLKVQSPETMVPGFPNLRRFPIHGSNHFFEIEFISNGDGRIRIERKR